MNPNYDLALQHIYFILRTKTRCLEENEEKQGRKENPEGKKKKENKREAFRAFDTAENEPFKIWPVCTLPQTPHLGRVNSYVCCNDGGGAIWALQSSSLSSSQGRRCGGGGGGAAPPAGCSLKTRGFSLNARGCSLNARGCSANLS